MSLTKKVAFNTGFQIAGKAITTVLSLIVIAALTRYLGVEGYGQYTTIFTYVSFAAVIADFGFFWVLVRELAKPGAKPQFIFNNIITLKIIFAIVVFGIATGIAFLIPQYSLLIKTGIAITAAAWFWMTLNNTYVGLFQAKLEMYKAVITDIVGRIVILFGVLYLIHLGMGLRSILGVYFIGNFVNFALSWVFGQRHIKFQPKYNKDFWKIILKESFPLAMLAFIGIINFKIDTIIISIIKTDIDVGIYGVPYKILEIIILIPSMFMGNVFPILTRYFHNKDSRFNDAIQKSSDFLLLLGTPIVAGLIILAKPIIKTIAGPEYLIASTVQVFGVNIAAPQLLVILSFSIFTTFLIAVFSNLLTVVGKQSKQVMPMAVVTTFNVIANLIFIPYYSYLAAAIITVCCEVFMLIWWNFLTRKYIDFKINYNIFGRVFLATLIMSIFLYFTKTQNIFWVIPVAMIIYTVFAFLLKIIDKSTLKRVLPL